MSTLQKAVVGRFEHDVGLYLEPPGWKGYGRAYQLAMDVARTTLGTINLLNLWACIKHCPFKMVGKIDG